jgi:hypothetical protein
MTLPPTSENIWPTVMFVVAVAIGVAAITWVILASIRINTTTRAGFECRFFSFSIETKRAARKRIGSRTNATRQNIQKVS